MAASRSARSSSWTALSGGRSDTLVTGNVTAGKAHGAGCPAGSPRAPGAVWRLRPVFDTSPSASNTASPLAVAKAIAAGARVAVPFESTQTLGA
jgi:hypothetical protein